MNPFSFRVGIGYDTHTLRQGGPLRLGGVDVPADVELVGHSDADVLLHAVIDALLGAAGLGDIGDHFPPSEDRFKGVDSAILMNETLRHVRGKGFEPVNVDVVVVVENPKLGKHKKEMMKRLAEVLDLPRDCVNVKATTNESMGFIGRGEGIAVMAVALLRKRSDG